MLDIIEEPEEPQKMKKIIRSIDDIGKFAGCKICMWRSVASLYTGTENSESQSKEISFTIALKRIPNLGIHLPNFYNENHKIMSKVTKEDLSK
jgi:hypothetical protein